jgi:hypothetical protein
MQRRQYLVTGDDAVRKRYNRDHTEAFIETVEKNSPQVRCSATPDNGGSTQVLRQAFGFASYKTPLFFSRTRR